MAQPAPARTSAARKGPLSIASRLGEWFLSKLDRAGWTAIPRTPLELGLRKLEPVQMMVYLTVLNRTVGDFQNDRPEWARIPYKVFCEAGNCDTRAIDKAMAALAVDAEALAAGEVPKGCLAIIERRGQRRATEYRIRNFTLEDLPDRPKRKLALVEDEAAEDEPLIEDEAEEDELAEDEELATAEPIAKPRPLRGGQQWSRRLKKPAEVRKIAFQFAGPKSERVIVDRIRFGARSRTCLIDLKASAADRGASREQSDRDQETRTPVRISRPQVPAEGNQRETRTPVRVSREAATQGPNPERSREDSAKWTEVDNALTPLFIDRWRSAPSPQLIEDTVRNLGDAPVAFLIERISIKLRSRYDVREGLIPQLASDAAAAWKALPDAKRQRYLTGGGGEPGAAREDSAQVFDAEPIDASTDWSRIRRELLSRGLIHQQEFENWFAATAEAGLAKRGPRKGELAVRVPDQVTAEYLEMEHADRIIEAGQLVGIPITSLRCLPPEVES